jgi:hypothetical protein
MMTNELFNHADPLCISGEMSLIISITGPKNMFIDVHTNKNDGEAVLDVDDARELRDWLNKVLP